jgi:formate dehydrogenase major subunit
MLLTKKSSSVRAAGASSLVHHPTMDRRGFLRRSGLGVGVGLAATQLTLVKKAKAAGAAGGMGTGKVEVKRTVCTHCSVGCATDAVVENGVWVRQEPVFDSPSTWVPTAPRALPCASTATANTACATPMKLVNGKYQRISWDTALDEITAKMLELREASGPDSVYFVGSSKHNNEQAYLLRKFVSFWGTNNCDHQARICHSTTVAGVANTWGYGAMTNSYNDMQNSKVALYIGSNAAEAHPVSMLHMLHAKEHGCKMIVVDPRFTRTAAKADEYVRIRSGTDIPFLFGLLHHIFKNGWEDKKYINDRVYGMDKIRDEVLAKWTPDKVEEACGVKEEQMLPRWPRCCTRTALAPSSGAWARRSTASATPWCVPRASCSWRWATSAKPAAAPTSSAAMTTCRARPMWAPTPIRCPATTAWPRVRGSTFATWGVEFDWIKAKYTGNMMEQARHHRVALDRRCAGEERADRPGQQPARRVLLGPCAQLADPRSGNEARHGQAGPAGGDRPLSVSHGRHGGHARQAEDLNPNRAVYLLPAATQFETSGSCTASNRSLQWREKVIEPLWESRSDHMIMHQFADKLGFGKELVKNYKMQKVKGMDEPVVEDILREINRSVWTIGYTGQSPERLKAHMRNMGAVRRQNPEVQGQGC